MKHRKRIKPMDYNKMAEIYKRPPVRMPTMPKPYNTLNTESKEYYYIFCKVDGRVALLGPYNGEDEAYSVAVSKLNTTFNVISMNTRDRGEATRRLRHKILDNSSDLGLSLRRMRHSV